jgi:hypothetical protein
MATTEKTTLKHYCEKCQGDTNHHILLGKRVGIDDPEYRLDWKYYMVQCMGCEEISFRKETHDYEVAYPDDDDKWTYEISVEIYPLPLKNHGAIDEQYILPAQIRTVYKETLEALKANCFLLAGVGFRAVIEAVCIDKQITGRTLEAKINNLSKNRFITDKEMERLHAVRFMGNDSVHDMAVPKEKALYVVLEIIEHLLKNLYIIDHHAKPVLDTFITDFEDFEEILIKKIKKFKKGDEFPLAKYLDKDVRRLNGQIAKFEAELIATINKGEFDFLTIGAVKKFGTNTTDNFQHFIKAK